MRKPWTMNTSISRHRNNSLMLRILYSVLLLVAGKLEFTTQVGLRLSAVSLAGQGRCQQEKPEEEHLADLGRELPLTAGTLQAATRASLSPPPGEEGSSGLVEALPSLLWQRRIAG